jgi:ribose transport system permease protein
MKDRARTGLLSYLGRAIFASRTPAPALLAFLIAISVVFGIFNKLYFSWQNINSIVNNLTFVGVLCLGMTVIIVSGCIDLSIGSNIALCSVLITKMFEHGFSIPTVIILTLVLGCVIGAVNGLLVNGVEINSIIATLGTMTTLKGLALLFTQTKPMNVNTVFTELGRGYVLQFIPITAVYFVILLLLFSYVMKLTVYGRNLYFVGSNPQAAHLSGINVKRTRFLAFIISGLVASFASLIITSQLSHGRPEMGEGAELEVITIVVLGGVSMSGGTGSYIGVVIALVLMTVIGNGMVLMDLPIFWRYVARGVILIIALLADSLKTQRRIEMAKLKSIKT